MQAAKTSCYLQPGAKICTPVYLLRALPKFGETCCLPLILRVFFFNVTPTLKSYTSSARAGGMHNTTSARSTIGRCKAQRPIKVVVVFTKGGNRMCSKTSFEKNCFSAWASTLNMGLINKVDMVCLSPVGYGV